MQLYTDSWTVANGFAGIKDLEEQNWNISDREVWGRGMWIGLSGLVKNMNISVCHVNVHKMVTLLEKNFNNRIGCSILRTTASLKVTPVIAQWAHEQSGSGGRDESYERTQQPGLPLSKVTWPQLCWVPNLPATETSTEFLVCRHSQEASPSCLVGGWLYSTTSIMEGETFCS